MTSHLELLIAANAWGAEHHVKFDFLEQQRWLYANVERVPESGVPFPCSEWNIILTFHLDEQQRSMMNEVSTVGACL